MADDPFTLLGLRPTASVKEVQQAFRQLAMVHHPDRGGNAVEFDKLMKASREAQVIAADQEPANRPCPTCGGTRRVFVGRGFATTKVACPTCQGAGKK